MKLTAGTELGRYEIRSKIGEGGMGEYETFADRLKESGNRKENHSALSIAAGTQQTAEENPQHTTTRVH